MAAVLPKYYVEIFNRGMSQQVVWTCCMRPAKHQLLGPCNRAGTASLLMLPPGVRHPSCTIHISEGCISTLSTGSLDRP